MSNTFSVSFDTIRTLEHLQDCFKTNPDADYVLVCTDGCLEALGALHKNVQTALYARKVVLAPRNPEALLSTHCYLWDRSQFFWRPYWECQAVAAKLASILEAPAVFSAHRFVPNYYFGVCVDNLEDARLVAEVRASAYAAKFAIQEHTGRHASMQWDARTAYNEETRAAVRAVLEGRRPSSGPLSDRRYTLKITVAKHQKLLARLRAVPSLAKLFMVEETFDNSLCLFDRFLHWGYTTTESLVELERIVRAAEVATLRPALRALYEGLDGLQLPTATPKFMVRVPRAQWKDFGLKLRGLFVHWCAYICVVYNGAAAAEQIIGLMLWSCQTSCPLPPAKSARVYRKNEICFVSNAMSGQGVLDSLRVLLVCFGGIFAKKINWISG